MTHDATLRDRLIVAARALDALGQPVTSFSLARALGMPDTKGKWRVLRELRKMKADGVAEQHGEGRNTRWRLCAP